MVTILNRFGLIGKNKGCRDLYGELRCPRCYSKRIKLVDRIGSSRTQWRCKDASKYPDKHESGDTFTYDRSNYKNRRNE